MMNNMWTMETVTIPSKREVDFFTVSYTNGSTVYMLAINEIKLILDEECYEKHLVPIITQSAKDEFFDILPKDKIPSHIFEEDSTSKWQRFFLFVNTNKKQVIFYESNTDREILLEGDDYAKIITYFHDNFYTSWIFSTTNINYQVDGFKSSE
jgi:hypothetical protein|nr:MAG TPA: hypothetical protein [Caudoviricetes sp.]